MAAFVAEEVPPGTRLYAKPPSRHNGTWNTHEPNVANFTVKEFIVAVHREAAKQPYVFAAYYCCNNHLGREDNPGGKGWYIRNVNGEFHPILHTGDVLLGWMELPEFAE